MNKKVPTATIGISALNEEKAIKQLLISLLKQKQEGFKIAKIFIMSDGSDDNTVKIARSVRSPKVRVFDYKARRGKAFRLNFCMEKCKADVFVALDADLKIDDQYFITKIVKPVLKEKYDLVSADLQSLPGKNLFEKTLVQGLNIKRHIKYRWNKGDNYLSCHGTARAFSNQICKRFRYIQSVGDDAYSYLWAKKYGYRYLFVKNAVALIRQPSSFKDHLKQSIRFQQNEGVLENALEVSVVEKYMKIPVKVYLESTLFALPTIILHPLLTISYVAVVLYSRFLFMNKLITMKETWSAQSSKAL